MHNTRLSAGDDKWVSVKYWTFSCGGCEAVNFSELGGISTKLYDAGVIELSAVATLSFWLFAPNAFQVPWF